MASKTIIVSLILTVCSAFVYGQKKDKKDEKKIKTGVKYTTESGLQYVINQKGNGRQAQKGDKVSVHYTGKLTNDTVFDTSYKRGQPISFKLGAGQVIKGWDEGIALLHVGDKATFTIPANLGYGEMAVGNIPANSTLIFDVELVDAKEPVVPKPFDVKGKDTITTASGLKLIKLNSTEGVQPQTGQYVVVNYSGYLLDGKMFDSSVERGEPFSFPLGRKQVIPGWDEGIALLKVGEKARLVIPYQLAYGERGIPPVIPPSSTLVFDVELLEVKGQPSK